MTNQDILNQIEHSFVEGCNVKAYFKKEYRLPMYGKFVQLKDYGDLLKKGMIRFCSEANREEFEKTNHVKFTRIYVIFDFLLIKCMV